MRFVKNVRAVNCTDSNWLEYTRAVMIVLVLDIIYMKQRENYSAVDILRKQKIP